MMRSGTQHVGRACMDQVGNTKAFGDSRPSSKNISCMKYFRKEYEQVECQPYLHRLLCLIKVSMQANTRRANDGLVSALK
jgi:hypothetical protein